MHENSRYCSSTTSMRARKYTKKPYIDEEYTRTETCIADTGAPPIYGSLTGLFNSVFPSYIWLTLQQKPVSQWRQKNRRYLPSNAHMRAKKLTKKPYIDGKYTTTQTCVAIDAVKPTAFAQHNACRLSSTQTHLCICMLRLLKKSPAHAQKSPTQSQKSPAHSQKSPHTFSEELYTIRKETYIQHDE